MTTHVRTKWHKVLPLLKQNNVYLTKPSSGNSPHWDTFGGRPERVAAFVKQMSNEPHFVIDEALMQLAHKETFLKSMVDMRTAGVLRLPFPVMVIEFARGSDNRNRNIVVLRDLHHDGLFPWESDEVLHANRDEADFYGLRFSIEQDAEGEYLCVGANIVYMRAEMKNGAPWVHLIAHGNGFVPVTKKSNDFCDDTKTRDAGPCFKAACAAYLLMSTQGVDKEVILCDKINRKRSGADEQPKIPNHTYIYIGKVYRSADGEEAENYVPRRSPLPHWRRGHLKNVRYGEGRKLTYARFIPARLVAFHGGKLPQAKAYVVKP